jgi:hypothetical protein
MLENENIKTDNPINIFASQSPGKQTRRFVEIFQQQIVEILWLKLVGWCKSLLHIYIKVECIFGEFWVWDGQTITRIGHHSNKRTAPRHPEMWVVSQRMS